MKKRICVVMGVANEAGLRLASEYAEDGFQVVLAGKQDQDLTRYQQALQQNTQKVKTYFTNPEEFDHFSQVETLFQQIHREQGEVTALIFNESIYQRDFNGNRGGKNPFQDVRLNNARLLTAINQVLPGMRKYRSGAIHLTGPEFHAEYTDRQLTEALQFARVLAHNLSREMDQYGIRVWQDSPYGSFRVMPFAEHPSVNWNYQHSWNHSNNDHHNWTPNDRHSRDSWNNQYYGQPGYSWNSRNPWSNDYDYSNNQNYHNRSGYYGPYNGRPNYRQPDWYNGNYGPAQRYYNDGMPMGQYGNHWNDRYTNHRGESRWYNPMRSNNRMRAHSPERHFSRYELSPQGELMEEAISYNGQA